MTRCQWDATQQSDYPGAVAGKKMKMAFCISPPAATHNTLHLVRQQHRFPQAQSANPSPSLASYFPYLVDMQGAS